MLVEIFGIPESVPPASLVPLTAGIQTDVSDIFEMGLNSNQIMVQVHPNRIPVTPEEIRIYFRVSALPAQRSARFGQKINAIVGEQLTSYAKVRFPDKDVRISGVTMPDIDDVPSYDQSVLLGPDTEADD